MQESHIIEELTTRKFKKIIKRREGQMMRCFCLPPKLTLMEQNNQAPKTRLFLSLFADAKKKIQKDFIEKDYFFLT